MHFIELFDVETNETQTLTQGSNKELLKDQPCQIVLFFISNSAFSAVTKAVHFSLCCLAFSVDDVTMISWLMITRRPLGCSKRPDMHFPHPSRWLPVRQQLYYRHAIMAFKCMSGCAPDSLFSKYIQRATITNRTTRNSQMRKELTLTKKSTPTDGPSNFIHCLDRKIVPLVFIISFYLFIFSCLSKQLLN